VWPCRSATSYSPSLPSPAIRTGPGLDSKKSLLAWPLAISARCLHASAVPRIAGPLFLANPLRSTCSFDSVRLLFPSSETVHGLNSIPEVRIIRAEEALYPHGLSFLRFQLALVRRPCLNLPLLERSGWRAPNPAGAVDPALPRRRSAASVSQNISRRTIGGLFLAPRAWRHCSRGGDTLMGDVVRLGVEST
jgi:hypothetical protein